MEVGVRVADRFAMAASLSGRVGIRMPIVAIGAFAAFGAVNLVFGYRSLGGVGFLTALYLVLSMVAGRGHVITGLHLDVLHSASSSAASPRSPSCRATTLPLRKAGLVWAPRRSTLSSPAHSAFWSAGGPRSSCQRRRLSTRQSSDTDRGPRISHIKILAARLSSAGYEIGAGPSDVGLIPAHSYLLGSWVWAGLLGGVFWLAILVLAGWLLLNLYAVRQALAPLLVFSTVLLVWNIVFSPYGSSAPAPGNLRHRALLARAGTGARAWRSRRTGRPLQRCIAITANWGRWSCRRSRADRRR